MTTENKADYEDIFKNVKDEELESIKKLRAINGRSQNDIEQNLVGLAFSGGGIRSATFGLGVLQALKEKDLLKKIDYLSTVSGGGYIGAWLSANCKRTADRIEKQKEKKAKETDKDKADKINIEPSWLDKEADWDDKSIKHLRRYSNYLSPNLSLLSADTWSMVTIWLRNTLLLQTMIVLFIAFLLLLPRVISPIIEFESANLLAILTFLLFAYLVIKIAGNLKHLKNDNDSINSEPSNLNKAIKPIIEKNDCDLTEKVAQIENINFERQIITEIEELRVKIKQIIKKEGYLDPSNASKQIIGKLRQYKKLEGITESEEPDLTLKIEDIIEKINFDLSETSKQIIGELRKYKKLEGVIQIEVINLRARIEQIIGDNALDLNEKIKQIEDVNLKLNEKSDQKSVQLLVIVSMLVSLGISAMLWTQLKGHPQDINSFWTYIVFIFHHDWLFLLLTYLAFVLFSSCSSRDNLKKWHWLVALPASIVLHLFLASILYVVVNDWLSIAGKGGSLLAFAWIPPLILGGFSLAINVLIGMQGKDSYESVREWWGRFGAWLSIYGFAWMVVVIIAFYGPLWSAMLYYDEPWKALGLGTGWIGTTLAGLFAGKSATTGGSDDKTLTTKSKEMIAKITPFIFIAGLLIIVAMILHLTIAVNSSENFTISQAELLGKSAQTDKQLALQIDAKPDVQIDVSVKQASVVEPTAQKVPEHSTHWKLLAEAEDNYCVILVIFGVCAFCLWLLNWRIDINVFSLSAFYRNRLTRCYLGATRFGENERHPHEFTGFDDDDDLKMSNLLNKEKTPSGPLHIINCALNLGGSSDLTLHTRHSANFTMTPLYCGSPYEVKKPDGNRAYSIGYRKTEDYGGKLHAPTLGQAISVSGAAASPNMGYHTSAPVAFLMTLFNARLGWWFPNPNPNSKSDCQQPSPQRSLGYILCELFGMANEKSKFLAISDGGHFENLAAYELVKRKCKVIIISDGECDPNLQFEGLGTLIRMCEVDNLATIKIEVRPIHRRDEFGQSRLCYSVGTIIYRNEDNSVHSVGTLIYIKASMSRDDKARNKEDTTAIMQYKVSHPDFPHETTGDQFYGEDQFESYRSLGFYITKQLLEQFKKKDKDDAVNLFDENTLEDIKEEITKLVDDENNTSDVTGKLKGLFSRQS